MLVTGAGGFIASHLVERLVGAGARVRAFVRNTSRNEVGYLSEVSGREELEVVAGDLRDLQAVDEAVKGEQVVFHLGALISIPYSYLHPVEVVETNVNGSLNMLLACRNHGVEKLIHTSSSEVYGTAVSVPMDEGHPLQGQSPYSASKIGADKLAESFHCAYGMPVTTIRPFNTYGPRQTARAVIPAIIAQALTREVVKLGTLETRRDFTYVDDTVGGLILAAETEGLDGKVINLGSGSDISINELAQLIIEMTGRTVKVERDESRLRPEGSEVLRLRSDNSLAKRLIGWRPKVTLEEGLKRTIQWIEQHIDRFNPDRYVF